MNISFSCNALYIAMYHLSKTAILPLYYTICYVRIAISKSVDSNSWIIVDFIVIGKSAILHIEGGSLTIQVDSATLPWIVWSASPVIQE